MIALTTKAISIGLMTSFDVTYYTKIKKSEDKWFVK